ncbi:MAG: LysR family transcriptional regulator [Ottowia sp.]|uniref:LysR family transcriptional regulator n=1 Tax=Ottowia sp. TaxID=1898956 RepID=UPI0039E656DB
MNRAPLDLQRKLTLKQLRLLGVLGEELNLSRSAERLHTTQPALSRALAQLEGVVRRPLFERTTKRVVPTPAGLALIQHAHRVLAQIDLAEQDLLGLQQSTHAPLVVGVLPVFSHELLAAAVTRVRAVLPGALLRIRMLDQVALYEQLLDGGIDLMLAHAEIRVDLNRVEVRPLYEEHNAVLCGPQHRLARRRRVGWAELAREAWVLPPQGTPLRPKLDRLLSVHRSPGHETLDVETDSSLLAMQLLRHAPLLWSIASRLAALLETSGQLVRLNAPSDLVRGPICCMKLHDRVPSTAMRLLMDGLEVAAREQRPGA